MRRVRSRWLKGRARIFPGGWGGGGRQVGIHSAGPFGDSRDYSPRTMWCLKVGYPKNRAFPVGFPFTPPQNGVAKKGQTHVEGSHEVGCVVFVF